MWERGSKGDCRDPSRRKAAPWRQPRAQSSRVGGVHWRIQRPTPGENDQFRSRTRRNPNETNETQTNEPPPLVFFSSSSLTSSSSSSSSSSSFFTFFFSLSSSLHSSFLHRSPPRRSRSTPATPSRPCSPPRRPSSPRPSSSTPGKRVKLFLLSLATEKKKKKKSTRGKKLNLKI